MRRLTIAAAMAALLGISGAHAALDLTLGSPKNTNIPPNKSGPKNFEGVWWPEGGSSGMGGGGPPGAGGPPGGGAGGPPGGGAGGPPGGGAGGPPGGGAGGPPGGGAGGDTDGNGRLQCKPQFKLAGGGGGSTVFIAQSSKQLIMAGEELSYTFKWVEIGGKHPDKVTPQPNGYSVGKWEGNTLVVDTVGYSDNDGKDSGKRVVERFTKDGNFLNIEIETTQNGKTTKSSDKWQWRPDLQINESICEEDFDRYRVVNGVTQSDNVR